jgi:hypothetical protein
MEVPGRPELTARYRHEHPTKPTRSLLVLKREEQEINPLGGKTTCNLFRDGDLVATGESNCHPKENFVKAMGRTIALGRALKALAEADAHGVQRPPF